MLRIDIKGRAMIKPARIGLRPANQEAKAINTPERRDFVKNQTNLNHHGLKMMRFYITLLGIAVNQKFD